MLFIRSFVRRRFEHKHRHAHIHTCAHPTLTVTHPHDVDLRERAYSMRHGYVCGTAAAAAAASYPIMHANCERPSGISNFAGCVRFSVSVTWPFTSPYVPHTFARTSLPKDTHSDVVVEKKKNKSVHDDNDDGDGVHGTPTQKYTNTDKWRAKKLL